MSELMDLGGNGWNVPLIRDIFMEEEVELICSLPLSKYQQADKEIWRATSTGDFTVKNDYYMEKEKVGRMQGEGSTVERGMAMWKFIWAIQVPNNVSVFLWKLCNDILPTKANLLRKGVVKDALCMFCEREVETCSHAIWQCPAAQDVWGAGPRKLQKCQILARLK